MPVFDLSRLLASRLFWEVVVLAVLAVVILAQMDRLDRWRGMVRQAEVERQLHALNQESQARQQTINGLKAQIVERDRDLARLQAERERLVAVRPAPAVVAKRVQEATATDEGLVAETHRVLPGIPVRLARQCD